MLKALQKLGPPPLRPFVLFVHRFESYWIASATAARTAVLTSSSGRPLSMVDRGGVRIKERGVQDYKPRDRHRAPRGGCRPLCRAFAPSPGLLFAQFRPAPARPAPASPYICGLPSCRTLTGAFCIDL